MYNLVTFNKCRVIMSVEIHVYELNNIQYNDTILLNFAGIFIILYVFMCYATKCCMHKQNYILHK